MKAKRAHSATALTHNARRRQQETLVSCVDVTFIFFHSEASYIVDEYLFDVTVGPRVVPPL